MRREENDTIAFKRTTVFRKRGMSVTEYTDETGMLSVELWAWKQVVFAVDRMADRRVFDADGRQLGTLDEVKAALAAFVNAL